MIRYRTSPAAKKIVIIDHDTELVKLMTDFLSSHGFDIVPCTEGKEAVTLIVREQYVDLIIIDYELTGIDFWVIEEIMVIVKREIPIIILTDKTIPSQTEQKKYCFFTKPIDLNKLLQTVSKIFEPRA